MQLFAEGQSIQNRIPDAGNKSSNGHSREKSDITFSNLVFSGKIHSAIRYLSSEPSGGVLDMETVIDEQTGVTVRDALLQKHPQPVEPPESALLADDPQEINPIIYDRITPELIRRIGRQVQGSSGPSGLDADAWCRMLTCYKKSSDRLCSALAAFARCLCTEKLESGHLTGFTTARLIPLDKKPGVRPIAVGEVFRRIVGRAIMKVVERDVLLATSPFQLCVGIPSACEAGVHAMRELFAKEDVQGILFVDASNAFNSLNRKAALHNVHRVCPALATVFQNTYGQPIRLFVSGGGEILSMEGTCQGDPLAMALYAVSIMPLIQQLKDSNPSVAQGWYADDDAAAGTIHALAHYWTDIQSRGSGFGYHPNPKKTVLLVKPECEEEARRLFSPFGVAVTMDGNRHLGGVVGGSGFCETFMKSRVQGWEKDLDVLSTMAQTQPQAAYAVFTKGFASKWTYHLRCSPCALPLLANLDRAINERWIPTLLGDAILPMGIEERELLSFPVRFGVLAVPILADSAIVEFAASAKITKPLVQQLLAPETLQPLSGGPPTTVGDAVRSVRQLAREAKNNRNQGITERVTMIKREVTDGQRFLLEIAREKGVSSWLTVSPRWRDKTVMKRTDFRDALCIRYGYRLADLPEACVCGRELTTSHALTCHTGGYTVARHNEVRDLIADLIREAGIPDVETEPKLLPCNGSDIPGGRSLNRSDEARLDVRARGFCLSQQDAFFDVRITHPAASVLSRPEALSQLRSHERAKKTTYASRVVNVDRGSFTPLVFSTYGICGPETTIFLKSLASLFVERNRDLSYSVVMGLLRTQISFCLMRWCVTCFRGCRSSYTRRRGASFVSQCRQLQ